MRAGNARGRILDTTHAARARAARTSELATLSQAPNRLLYPRRPTSVGNSGYAGLSICP
jgi:hypothetical protein